MSYAYLFIRKAGGKYIVNNQVTSGNFVVIAPNMNAAVRKARRRFRVKKELLADDIWKIQNIGVVLV